MLDCVRREVGLRSDHVLERLSNGQSAGQPAVQRRLRWRMAQCLAVKSFNDIRRDRCVRIDQRSAIVDVRESLGGDNRSGELRHRQARLHHRSQGGRAGKMSKCQVKHLQNGINIA